MKRTLILLLTVLFLMSSLTACGSRQTTYDLKMAGVSFDLPESMQHIKGFIQSNYGIEIEQGSGVYLAGLSYIAMTRKQYSDLAKKGSNLTEEDIAFATPRIVDFVIVYAISGGRTIDDVAPLLEASALPLEGCRELGTVGEYSFYYLPDPLADELDSKVIFDKGFREQYDKLIEACNDPSWIRIYEPEAVEKAESGAEIAFETTDLDGNTVSSADIFSRNKITMVNLWGTYCAPCLNEMPDLEELNGRLDDKDCAIVGVVIDVKDAKDDKMIATAKDCVADTGVTYLNLVPWEELFTDLPAQFVPTTYFIDSDGHVVGEPAIGAKGADEYEALLDAALASLN